MFSFPWTVVNVAPRAVELPHRRLHGLRHIEEFQIDEDLLARRGQLIDQLEVAASHEQFEAELVKLDAVAELGH